MTPLSKVFLKLGDTAGGKHFDRTNSSSHLDWQSFQVNLTPAEDPEPFPSGADIRFIITPSDRYSPALANPDRAFPVGGIDTSNPAPPPNTFKIIARNSDTSAAGGFASFFWLAIAENATRTNTANTGLVIAPPLNQTYIGQPANFSASAQNIGDHQVLPNFYMPERGNIPPPLELAGNGRYSFQQTFGTAAFPAPPSKNRPLIFVTANNVGCGVSPNLSTHNAATVGMVVDTGVNTIDPQMGFSIMARNADAAGACGFNWVALLQLFGAAGRRDVAQLPPGAPPPTNLSVDTGLYVAPNPAIANTTGPIDFTQTGTSGAWFTGEVQFSAPFATEPVVLVTPQFSQPYIGNSGQNSSCAPICMVQNPTRFGFTLAAYNTDTNNVGGQASFYWVAFGQPA